ncbi:MAG: hypothetical protein IKY83_10380, partial [Proteobacteria bacterium]|nr:hypothetical protein [Pseudomonadota bacterium]
YGRRRWSRRRWSRRRAQRLKFGYRRYGTYRFNRWFRKTNARLVKTAYFGKLRNFWDIVHFLLAKTGYHLREYTPVLLHYSIPPNLASFRRSAFPGGAQKKMARRMPKGIGRHARRMPKGIGVPKQDKHKT